MDNIAAVYGAVKGSIKNYATQILIEVLHDMLAEYDMVTYLAYVQSKQNIADIMTREERLEGLLKNVKITWEGAMIEARAL